AEARDDGRASRQTSAVTGPLISRSSVAREGVVQWSATALPTRWAERSATIPGRWNDGGSGGRWLARPMAKASHSMAIAGNQFRLAENFIIDRLAFRSDYTRRWNLHPREVEN